MLGAKLVGDDEFAQPIFNTIEVGFAPSANRIILTIQFGQSQAQAAIAGWPIKTMFE